MWGFEKWKERSIVLFGQKKWHTSNLKMDQKFTKIDKNVWICFLTELENRAAHSNRDLLTRFGCTPTNEPPWEIPKKTPFPVGMKMGHNPQEDPQIYLVISTHLKNLLIKLHQFSKNSWGKKNKKKETSHHLGFRCFLLFQTSMGGDLCWAWQTLFGVGQKCLLFVVCLWVFSMEVCGVGENDIFGDIFFGGP